MHIVLDFLFASIVFYGLVMTFNERIEKDLVIFIGFFFCSVGHFGHYVKKLYVHGWSMLKNESLHERTMGLKIHWKNEK